MKLNALALQPLVLASQICVLTSLAGFSQAQTIERMRMTDGDLNCQQIYAEVQQMDAAIKLAGSSQAPVPGAAGVPAAAVAAEDPSVANAGSQIAGAVAQQALGSVIGRGLGGGLFGGGGGGLFGGGGGLFGNLAQAAATQGTAQQAQQSAAQQLAAQAAAKAAPQAAPQPSNLAAQAQGRKEHLTGLFLGKSCKMSEIQR